MSKYGRSRGFYSGKLVCLDRRDGHNYCIIASQFEFGIDKSFWLYLEIADIFKGDTDVPLRSDVD